MQTVKVPRSPLSSQRVTLDTTKQEFILKLRWVSYYQRFYLSIYDTENNPIRRSMKLVPGCPINLGHSSDASPSGLFVVVGKGKIKRRSFESGAYSLYYIARGKNLQFPLIREYLIEDDINEYVLSNSTDTTHFDCTFRYIDAGQFQSLDLSEISFICDLELDSEFDFIDGDEFDYVDGELFEFI